MERLTPTEMFRKKRTTFEGCLLFPLLPKRPEFPVPFVCANRTRLRCEDYTTSLGGLWPPHLFVPSLLRHSEMDSQMERHIPFPISSVGNVQYHLSKISYRKFRLNSKRPPPSRTPFRGGGYILLMG